jgi:hypothetical protein
MLAPGACLWRGSRVLGCTACQPGRSVFHVWGFSVLAAALCAACLQVALACAVPAGRPAALRAKKEDSQSAVVCHSVVRLLWSVTVLCRLWPPCQSVFTAAVQPHLSAGYDMMCCLDGALVPHSCTYVTASTVVAQGPLSEGDDRVLERGAFLQHCFRLQVLPVQHTAVAAAPCSGRM